MDTISHQPRGQPLDHVVRLEALHETGLLDSLPEGSFDRFTRLAAALLDVDISLISLVDRNRQFFKSQVGLAEPLATRRETPVSHSFCQYVVTDGSPLVIEDAREDHRVRENLSVRDYEFIAYLGMPLTTRDGLVLGSLCAIDKHPRKWSHLDQSRLYDLAAAVIAEIELREQSLALKESLLASEASEEHRRSMLRMIVHDLRTPAGSILTCLEMLAEESVPLTAEQSELVTLCQESAGNLLAMINDIMELDRTEVGGSVLAKEPISASMLIRRAVRTIQPCADDAQIIVDVQFPDFLVPLNVDIRKLERVLLNLLTNALKYSPKYSTVAVILEVTESSGDKMCKITVRDSGPGVPDAKKMQIFNQFVTGSAGGERGIKSFGIGLSFCQMAIEAHGGKIAVADTPYGGSDFHFSLPLALGDEAAIVLSGV